MFILWKEKTPPTKDGALKPLQYPKIFFSA